MMKQLPCYLGALLLLALAGGCRPGQADRYQRYMEEVADTTFEYITPAQDSIDADGESVKNKGEEAGWADDDGLVAVPEIPQERRVNMGADDYELKKVMSGKASE